jgi:pimeloyl-ACP methyl ester carboxylesterase
LQAQGEAGVPGADRLAFDPETAYATAGDEVQFGGGFGAKLLVPLQQLSFWSMKDRARQVGESGLHDFVAALMNAVPPGRDLRFHLMGHSFGCIVMSSVATGRNAQGRLPKPLQSVVLVQGALSLWSYCTSIPSEPSKKGHFRALVEGNRVSGPVCLTTSEFDRAVGILYPAAAGVAKQVEFVPGELPKYGAVGTFGAQGPGVNAVEEAMHPLNQPYQFQPGAVYNFNSSQFICDGGGVSGAHSDISKPEVAQLIWSAAL